MPYQMDPVAIGQTIKDLLKKHQMTQDQLASHLNISKSAVSQNLNGKSSFDIQNLIAIARLFNVSVDILLGLSEETQRQASEYDKIVEKGLSSINHVSPSQLQVFKPDVYGKVLIEYIMDAKHMVMFKYLMDHHVQFVSKKYIRAKDITLKVLLFVLENNLDGVLPLYYQYIELSDGLNFDHEAYEALFYSLINQEKHDDLIEIIIESITAKKQLKSFLKKELNAVNISMYHFLKMMTKYHLKYIFEKTFNKVNLESYYLTIVNESNAFNYYELIHMFLTFSYQSAPSSFKQLTYQIQRATEHLVKSKQAALIQLALEKQLYYDITSIFNLVLEQELTEIAQWIFTHYAQSFSYTKVNYVLFMKYPILLQSLIDNLDQHQKEVILASLDEASVEMMLYLLKQGVKVNPDLAKAKTIRTMNLILEKYIKGENA